MVGHGLSPRVRGNHLQLDLRRQRLGSIPACAGEPKSGRHPLPRRWVYPRVCGGTMVVQPRRQRRGGLSPRVRGNPDHADSRRERTGSIPACAGEPCGTIPTCRRGSVYPRVCGGTRIQRLRERAPYGLSPRVRGNQQSAPQGAAEPGSIPACAGEPASGPSPPAPAWVYPRVCGGTSSSWNHHALAAGLSPRVRGNPVDAGRLDARLRSIPACAGEPTRSRRSWRFDRVYPRVCGGTTTSRPAGGSSWGLSPRVRGNLWAAKAAWVGVGSIPACAGEPSKRGIGL